MKESPFDKDSGKVDVVPAVRNPRKDVEAEKRAKQQVTLPGRLMVASSLLGMAPSIVGLLFSLLALPQATNFEQRVVVIVFACIAALGLGWYGATIYGAVKLLDRRSSVLVWAATAMLLIGAVVLAILVRGFLWFHAINGILVLATCVLVALALQNADVKAAILERRSNRRKPDDV